MSLSVYGCGVKNTFDDEVVLIDIGGVTSYDLKNAMSKEGRKVVQKNEKNGLTYSLTSVATNTVFNFDTSVIDLSKIYKEYYLVSVLCDDQIIYTGKFDFHDYINDGMVWCEMTEYTAGAVRTDSPSDIGFEYAREEFIEGNVVYAEPIDPIHWRFSYYMILPWHSKEYYEHFMTNGTMIEFTYARRAIVDSQSWNFDPTKHVPGEYAPKGCHLNIRHFACGGNVPHTANVLHTLEFRLQDVLDKFDVLGKFDVGASSYWYFIGTCHDGNNPWRIRYMFSSIDIYND
jgi:hypothetical protein